MRLNVNDSVPGWRGWGGEGQIGPAQRALSGLSVARDPLRADPRIQLHYRVASRNERYTEKGHAEITRRRERDILYRGDIITIHLLSRALRLRPKTTTLYTKVL